MVDNICIDIPIVAAWGIEGAVANNGERSSLALGSSSFSNCENFDRSAQHQKPLISELCMRQTIYRTPSKGFKAPAQLYSHREITTSNRVGIYCHRDNAWECGTLYMLILPIERDQIQRKTRLQVRFLDESQSTMPSIPVV